MKKILLGFILTLGIFVLAACGTTGDKSGEFTITYNTNGGTVIEDVVYVEGETFELPANPSLDGNTFDGWYLDAGFTEAFSLKEPITRSINLYAKFTTIEYNVSYNMLGGDPVDSFNLETGEMIFPKINPTNEGFDFINYYYDEELTQVFGFEDMPAHDVVLYAKWEQSSFGVLSIVFVPSRPAEEIYVITEPLKQMMLDNLAAQGFEFEDVEISVSATYESAGLGLGNGTFDVAFLPATTYVLYADSFDSIEAIVSASRFGLNKDFTDPMDWNDGLPTVETTDTYKNYYRGLIIAGTSTAARALAAKVNSGTELVWDDVKDLTWCVRSETSSSGYIYQNYWLQQNFGKTFDDIANVFETSGYGATMADLATGNCDVGNVYADARMHYVDRWTSDYGRTESIWAETDVVGVTVTIMNDLIAANNENLSPDLIAALQIAFMEIIETEDGGDVFDVYSHRNYMIATDEMFDELREVLNMN